MPKFSDISTKRLQSCDDRLQKLFKAVILDADCSILCGHRGKEEQDKAYAEGFSKVQFPNSKHNTFPSMAVDAMPYPINWMDLDRIHAFANIVRAKAKEMGIEVRWGGEFVSFKDYPHWELNDL